MGLNVLHCFHIQFCGDTGYVSWPLSLVSLKLLLFLNQLWPLLLPGSIRLLCSCPGVRVFLFISCLVYMKLSWQESSCTRQTIVACGRELVFDDPISPLSVSSSE